MKNTIIAVLAVYIVLSILLFLIGFDLGFLIKALATAAVIYFAQAEVINVLRKIPGLKEILD